MLCLRHLPRIYRLLGNRTRHASTTSPAVIKIVEMSPRDGLQNEKTPLSVALKAELIDKLSAHGLGAVEAGSFVSPKWVPQMAGTPEVLKSIQPKKGVSYPVLVPNAHGLKAFLELRKEMGENGQAFDEIAVFTAASDAFNKANTNATIEESLIRLKPVAEEARREGLKVRGYVSTVVVCPFSGHVKPEKVREVSERLVEMGCYEISLGDTVGRATPESIRIVFEEVKKSVDVRMLAGHFHDTYGMGIANCAAAIEAGVRVLDASTAGLGGCPYSPGATGNVATEDVLYMIANSKGRYTTPVLYGTTSLEEAGARIESLAKVGIWISEKLGRETSSRAGKAIVARREWERERERKRHEKEKAKL